MRTMLSAKELASRWGVTYGFLRDQRARGEGPDYVKLGNGSRPRIRYPVDKVEEYERQQSRREHDTMG